MKIWEGSIKRPVMTWMIIAIVLVLGAVSLSRLGLDLLPNINLPIAAVTASYQGAGPEEIETMVTRPLESVLGTVSNVNSVSSISSEGNSIIILEFNQGTDMDFAALDMREKVDLIKGMLPSGVTNPMVLKLDPTMLPVMQISVASKDGNLSRAQAVVEDTISNRIERIEGVASVSITGGRQREIAITVQPEKLATYGLSITQISNLLKAENLNMPGGTVVRNDKQLVIRTMGEFKSIDDIKALAIPTPAGGIVKLGDIADVADTFKEVNQYNKINGKESIGISVQKESTANTVQVADDVNAELEKLRQELPDVEIIPVLDQSQFIKMSINNVANNAILGAILAVIVLLMFLRNVRSSLVIALSIPISVIATFVLVYFSGMTLNLISMGGLALGVGMMVDNSIVVLENIYRHRQEGQTRMKAAIDGAGEVAMAITGSTLTTVMVFLPIIFVQSLAGEIFKELALTVTFSLLASLVVAITIVPMLASRLVTIEDESVPKRKTVWTSIDGFVSRALSGLDSFYRGVLKSALGHKGLTAAIVAAIFIGMIALIPFVGSEFLPPMDQGQFSVNIELPQGTVSTKTADITNKVEGILETIPEADTIYTAVGGNAMASMVGGMTGGSTNIGSINVTLVPKEQRTRTTDEIVEWVNQQVKNIPGANITVLSMNDVASGATGGGTASVMGAPISVDIKGDDMDMLADVADDIKELVETVPGVTSATTSVGEGAPELRLTIDRYKASQYGLNAATIASTVQSAINGQLGTRYKVEGREIDVTLYGDESYKTDPNKLSQLLIPTMTGGNVPLGELAKVEEAEGPVAINRQDLRRTVSVNVNISDRALGDVTADIQAKVDAYKLPSGYAVSYGGQSQMLNDAFSDLGLALILAIILVYMIMAAQFESFIHPFDIMFSVPLAFGGAILGLFITGKALSVPAYIGVIMLAGIVVNNAIVLIDYTNQLRDRGYSCEEALIKAGPTRLRPILMTTLTTILGLIPLALGIGEGAEMEAPMAITVIFGLGLSTIITLIIVPVIYSLFDRFSHRHHEPVDNIIPMDGREV